MHVYTCKYPHMYTQNPRRFGYTIFVVSTHIDIVDNLWITFAILYHTITSYRHNYITHLWACG